jgi:DNA-binding NarL/FixJ family response regulator
MLRVMIADDNPLVRNELRELIETEPDMTVVAEAADGLEVLHLVRRHQPHVVVMDISMPGADGLTVTRQLTDRQTDVAVVVCSGHISRWRLAAFKEAGAEACLEKNKAASDLVHCIRRSAPQP